MDIYIFKIQFTTPYHVREDWACTKSVMCFFICLGLP